MAGGFNPNTWPTFQQSMPMVQGVSAGEALRRAYLQNQMQKQQNQARPDMDAAKLAQIQQQNQFQPDLNAARLSQMQAATQGQQISNVQAPEMLNLRKHLADIAMRNAVGRQQQVGIQKEKMSTYQMRALTAAMNTPQGRAQLAQNPDMLKNLLSTQGAYTQKVGQSIDAPTIGGFTNQDSPPIGSMPGAPQPLTQQNAQQGSPQQMQSGQQSLDAHIQQAMQQQPSHQPQQPVQAQPQHSQQASDQQIAAIQDLLASKNLKDTTTAQISNQRQYSGLLDDLIVKATPDMTTAIKAYSGMAGTARLKKDQFKSTPFGGGTVTPELKAFNNTKNTATKFLANEVTRSLGESHNIATAGEMKSLANPIYWDKNPELALSQWNSFVSNSKTVSKSLAKSLAETEASLKDTSSQTNQLPQAQSSTKSPPVGSAAPVGTVRMVNPDDGKTYRVAKDQVDDAIASSGWSRA